MLAGVKKIRHRTALLLAGSLILTATVAGTSALAGPTEHAPTKSQPVAGSAELLPWVEEDHLTAADGSGNDRFGRAVAIDGTTALIGAPEQSNEKGRSAGAAYVFERGPNGSWSQQARLLAADGQPDDGFGFSVALDGDRVIVGAPRDHNANGFHAGSAYVYDRGPNGTWTQGAKLLSGDGAPRDFFGNAVALEDDRALVAAGSDTHSNAENAGSGYTFIATDGEWSQEAKLVADNVQEEFLGFSAALDGERALLGAPLGSVERALVFELDSQGWSQEAVLTPSDRGGEFGSEFGWAVALDGQQVLVGGPFHDNQNGEDAGVGYVFSHEVHNGWTQQARLLPEDGSANDGAGWSVGIDNGTAVLGETDRAFEATSAYLFTQNATGWSEQPRPLASNGAEEGWKVALDDGRLLVGEPREENTNGVLHAAGGAHVLRPLR